MLLLTVLLFTTVCGQSRETFSDLAESTASLASKLINLIATESLGTENILISPISIIMLYSMLLNNAKGKTRSQLIKTLQLKESSIDKLPSQLAQIIRKNSSKKTKVLFTNIIASNKQFQFNETFTDWANHYFKAKILNQNLSSKKFIKKLNRLISQSSGGLINDTFKEPLSRNVVLLLLNILYFSGSWSKQFNRKLTRKANFVNIDGTVSRINLMEEDLPQFINYYEYELSKGNTVKNIRLPLNGDYAVEIIVPDNSTNVNLNTVFKEFLKRNTNRDCSSRNFKISIPQFAVKSRYNLQEIMSKLGADKLFGEPEISGVIEGLNKLPRSISVHENLVKVTEEGIVAAAITSFITTYSFEDYDNFIVNKPFIFIIYNVKDFITYFAGFIRSL